MSEKNIKVTVGTPFFALLAILFIGLKLTGYIDWSWLWVLSPLWGPVALVLTIWAIILLFVFIVSLSASRQGKNPWR